MYTQKVFKAGNSYAVAIPRQFIDQYNIQMGQTVDIAFQGCSVIFTPKMNEKKTIKITKTKADSEFRQWLKNVLVEDKELLNELALR